jgi:hypothetical protein
MKSLLCAVIMPVVLTFVGVIIISVAVSPHVMTLGICLAVGGLVAISTGYLVIVGISELINLGIIGR